MDDGANTVVHAWAAEPTLLTDFLNDMAALQDGLRGGSDGSETDLEVRSTDPSGWGELVISRSAEGDILFIDPERYWNGISELFRTRGGDPHLWRPRGRDAQV